jgi:hypothetical protein
MRWWAAKIRRTCRYLCGRISSDERDELGRWLAPAQLVLFERMARPDQRHGLDVVAGLRAQGVTDPDLLVAGLVHDAGKGPSARLAHRVAWSLGQKYGTWIWRVAGRLPTLGRGLDRLRHHADVSADLAAQAGCSPRSVELIRRQDNPVDEAGRLLRAIDEAN